jgi:hypothetical protein
MRSLLWAVLLLAACTAPAATPSASPSGTATLKASPTSSPAASPNATPLPSAAGGGIEVFATGQMHGTYVWVVGEAAEPQDRVTESLYAVPLDGSPPKLVVRRLRPRSAPGLGGQSVLGIVPLRQISADGAKLALEQSSLGAAAQDGFVVVDMAKGAIIALARGDVQPDVMPAWSPDGTQIALARRKTTPGAPDDGLWVINADGTGIRRLLPGACCAQHTAVYGWTADGLGIAFALTFEGADYSIANVATGEVTGPHGQAFGLTPASWRVKTPQLAAAFSQGDKGGEQRIDVADGIGKPTRTIWHEPSDFGKGVPFLLSARWSPVADEILFLRTGQPAQIGRIRVGDAAPSVVATKGDPSHAEWIDGGRIAYTTNGGVSITDGAKVTVLWSAPGGATVTDLAVRTYP